MTESDRPTDRDTPEADALPLAVLALGIDNLGVLEELFSEEIGEEIAGAVAMRLQMALPKAAHLAMLPRRRFLAILPGHDAQKAEALAHALQETVASDIVQTAHGPVGVTVSAGCALVSDVAEPATGRGPMRAAALHALNAAMANGVGSFRMAADDLALLEYRRHLMATSRAAMDALGAESLALAFQPVVRASGGNTISFHECLVRIRHPNGRLITAGEFMPAIEQLGLATMIDRQVLLMSLEALIRHPGARLSVNIFPQTMQDRHWMSLFENAAAADPSLPERLILEVTESAALLDPPRTKAFMDRVRSHGTGFALDDFGAGSTALRYLRDFRFDMLKIDGYFVRDIDRHPDNAFIAETIVAIAQRFEMMTIAESVQTPAEARALSRAGFEFFQGFHFGSPSLLLEPTATPMPMVAAQA